MSLAPPATRGEFSYAGDFYVEASGHNRHRRATVPELKAFFKGTGDAKDHPAHWYEAQLIHYGLKPSKTKGTAKMRLFEAVNGTSLKVPSEIAKVEADLKKEWAKKEREAKAALKAGAASSTPAKGTKRKAEEASSAPGVFMKSMSVKADGSVNIEFMQNPSKKAKASVSTSAPAKPKATAATTSKKTPAAAPKTLKAPAKSGASKTTATKPATSKATSAKPAAPKSTVAKATPAKAPAKSVATKPTTASPSTKAPRTKTTAKRGGSFASGSSRATKTDTGPALASPPKKQTARRGGGHLQGKVAPPGTGSSSFHSATDYMDDDPPPPYPGSPMDVDDDDDHYYNKSATKFSSPQTAPPASLGLLNGRYNIDAPSIADSYPIYDQDMGFVLTLDGKALWGNFDFGYVRGIFFLPERPYTASSRQLNFTWRGKDEDGGQFNSSESRGWISFTGGGRVSGEIYWRGWHTFEGVRTSGQETRSEISAAAMRAEWEDYAEFES